MSANRGHYSTPAELERLLQLEMDENYSGTESEFECEEEARRFFIEYNRYSSGSRADRHARRALAKTYFDRSPKKAASASREARSQRPARRQERPAESEEQFRERLRKSEEAVEVVAMKKRWAYEAKYGRRRAANAVREMAADFMEKMNTTQMLAPKPVEEKAGSEPCFDAYFENPYTACMEQRIEGLTCVVCQETELTVARTAAEVDHTTAAVNPCGHICCLGCHIQWRKSQLEKGGDKYTCFLCRDGLSLIHQSCKCAVETRVLIEDQLYKLPKTLKSGKKVAADCADCATKRIQTSAAVKLEDLAYTYLRKRDEYLHMWSRRPAVAIDLIERAREDLTKAKRALESSAYRTESELMDRYQLMW